MGAGGVTGVSGVAVVLFSSILYTSFTFLQMVEYHCPSWG
ncbi:MAG TPA: hypothetical protein H9810_05010 [Candidatus Gemmiger excrementavium]|uniref:Uncharacterized protein n=1 Tax=Candidatus Gemmiger excrementavium TaxID=2838608 RepID=A0A9D2F207_9FIRM|nr:hypothetical protein [Candidatus Gemmiger excrementavium]